MSNSQEAPVVGSKLEVRMGALGPELEAIGDERWAELDGAGTPEETRAFLLAYADVLELEGVLFSAWDGGRLAGLASALVVESATKQRILSMEAMSACGPGVRVARSADPARVIPALLQAATAYCREHKISRVFMANCEAAPGPLNAAAQAEGFRSIEAPPDNKLELPRGTTFDQYLAGMRSPARHPFRRDLRRSEEVGARMVNERPPIERTLDLSWPLYLELTQRMESAYRFRGNLLSALARRFPAGDAALMGCWQGEALCGFYLYLYAGDWANLKLIGHATDANFQVYPALHAWTLKHLLEEGRVHKINLGPTVDFYKKRLGCASHPRVHFFRPVR